MKSDDSQERSSKAKREDPSSVPGEAFGWRCVQGEETGMRVNDRHDERQEEVRERTPIE